MNRAQRRRLNKEIEDMDKVINIKPHEIREKVEKEVNTMLSKKVDALILETVINSTAVTISVLHEKFGFGESRIKKFMSEYNALFDSILEERVNFEELKQVAMDMGVRLEVEKKEGGQNENLHRE